MKRIFTIFLVFALATAAVCNSDTPDKNVGKKAVYRVDDFSGGNDREKINSALLSMKALPGAKTLSFSKREYLIEPADRDTFSPVIGVDGVNQLTIEGNGAILVAKDALNCQKGYFFKISNFSDVVFKDITITYRPLPYVQGKVVSVNQKDNRVAVELDPRFNSLGSLKETPNSKIWCRIGLKDAPHLPKPGTPSWMEVKTDGESRIESRPVGRDILEFQTGYFNPEITIGGKYNWSEGDPIVIWKRGAQDGICFEGGRNLSLNNIKVESSLHFAIKLRGILKAEIVGCQVVPVPGGMISSSADGIDVQQSNGIIIEKCRVISSGDDAISLLNHNHGYNGDHCEKEFPAPYPDTNENILVRGNQLIGGNRNGILLLGSNAVVESNEILHVRQYGLKFAGDNTRISGNVFKNNSSFAAYIHIKDELDTGVICSDEWIQNNVTIEKNVIEDWKHMPGLLLKSVKGAKVMNNCFIMHYPEDISEKPFNSYLNQNKAICVTTGIFNNEIKKSSDITIVGNTVSASGVWKSFKDAIQINGECKNLEVENNIFKTINASHGD